METKMSDVILEVTLERILKSSKEVVKITGVVVGFKTFDSGHFILIADGNGIFYANPESYKITELITKSSYQNIISTPSYDYVKKEFDKFVRLGKIKLDDSGIVKDWKKFPATKRKTYKLDKGARILVSSTTRLKPEKPKEEYKLIVNKANEILEMLYDRKQRHSNANTNSSSGSS